MSLAIVVFAGAVLVLLWGALQFEAQHDEDAALRQARKDTGNLVVAFREHIGRTLTAIDQIMLAIKAEYLQDPDHYQLPHWLKNSPFLSGIAVQVSIIGADGFLRQSDLAGLYSRLDLSDRQHFRYQLDPSAPQPYISKPVVGRESGKLSIQISRRLEHGDGSFGGVLVFSFDPSYLSQFFETVDLGKHGVVVLIGRDGIVRARRSGTDREIGQDLSDTRLFEEMAKADRGTFVASSKFDGMARIYSFADVPDYPLVVSLGVAMDEILAGPVHERDVHNLLGVGISLVVVLLAALLLHEVATGRRREEEIGTQASLLRTVLDVTPGAIWVKDEQGRFEMINDATAQMFGRPKEEIIGQRAGDLVPADVAETISSRDEEATGKDGETVGGEHVFRIDGTMRHILAFRRTCVLGGRSLVVGAAMDVTSLRHAEEELRSQMRQRELAEAGLRQAQKMEAIGKLTGGVAHDFNNLLTSVLGNIELAARRVVDKSTLHLLQNAERAAQRGADLVQHLLAFARKQHLETGPVDLNRLVLGMRELLDHTIGSRIHTETVLDKGLWRALADANQVEAAILNIAINARDAMPKGGRIVVRTANVDAGATELPPELAATDYVSVTISDTGIGMDEDVLTRAFDPFFTTKEVGKGSGLGLSQVYGMARQSGGTATIDSAPGRGTSVRLYLPRATGKMREVSPVAPARADIRYKSATILVVDNDAEVRSIMAAYLGDAGHRVYLAAGTSTALDIAATAPVDLIIVDVFVADMAGGELIAEARRERPNLAILYVSGDTEAGFSKAAPILGKPFSAAQLLAAVDALLARSEDDDPRRGRRSVAPPVS
jgi:PAS domain S-box-containing protein